MYGKALRLLALCLVFSFLLYIPLGCGRGGTETSEEIQMETGGRVLLAEAELTIPEYGIQGSATVDIKDVGSPPKKSVPEDTHLVGQCYDITCSATLTKPATLSLKYDPSQVPEGATEENLYLAVEQGGRFVPVEGAVIDTRNHTISAALNHFSLYTVLCNMKKKMIGDEINRVFFSDLPQQIQSDLLQTHGYAISDITSVVDAKLSAATQVSSAIITFGNVLGSTVDIALGAASGAVVAVEETLKGAALYATETAGGETGEFIVRMYAAGATGAAVGEAIALKKMAVTAEEIAEAGAAAQVAAAALSAWILSEEMRYINEHMDQAFKDIWKFNTLSTDRLQVYAVYVDARSQNTNLREKGVKFYYWDEGSQAYVNYYDNMVISDLEFVYEESPDAQGEDQADQTATPAPTLTPAPTPEPAPIDPVQSSVAGTGAFAYDWFWSKQYDCDGRYAETTITIDLPDQPVSEAVFYISAGYSQEAGNGSATMYISTEQQVTPKDSDHHFDTWWVGDDANLGMELGTFTFGYAREQWHTDITSYINSNLGTETFYIAIMNNAQADIGTSGIYIEVK